MSSRELSEEPDETLSINQHPLQKEQVDTRSRDTSSFTFHFLFFYLLLCFGREK